MNNKPNINVTPLIDVLLVLLIIFMVVSPLKPTDFKTKIPHEAQSDADIKSNPDSLVVIVNPNSTLRLNAEDNLGTVQDSAKLTERLKEIFIRRAENHVYAEGAEFKSDLPELEKIQKTVFIKAPRIIDYGSVTKVIDAVKIAGANPISLQIDDLN
ncbi:MAG: biopolymer transporter ExbD [Pyrinomonadaceae bacterium]